MIAKATELLTSSGFTLPLVGENHPLRKAFHRTFTLSAVFAMAIHCAIAGGRLGADSLFRKPVTKLPGSIVILNPIPPPRLSEEVVTAPASLASEVTTSALGDVEPTPDFDAKASTIATTDEMAAMLDADASALTRAGDSLVVAADDGTQNAGDYEAVEVQPMLIHLPKPNYPPIARMAGVEGVVLLQLLVGEDGQVKEIRILEGPEMLQEAAVAAAKQGRFQPAQNQNRPVAAWVQVPMRFSLRT